MKTYYCDLGWEGGVVVMAENEEDALKIVNEKSYHKGYVYGLTELKPGEFHDFLGDSWKTNWLYLNFL